MPDILHPASATVLQRLAEAPALLAFDFDGTLAPIVADRDRAAMRPETRRLLTALCDGWTCAVVTGRAREDAVARLAGIPVAYIVGSHGGQPDAGPSPFAAMVAAARPHLARSLRDVDGVEVEDKGSSLAVHYRRAHDVAAARRRVEEAARETCAVAPLRIVAGILVVNLVPRDAPHKGDAVQRLCTLAGVARALYVGDDVTDEDVFSVADRCDILGVRVEMDPESAARYHVPNQRTVDDLLRRLSELTPARRRDSLQT